MRALERIYAAGITVNGCFVLGLDSHDPSVFEEIVLFVEESGLADVQVTVLTPFKGTPLCDRLKSERRLLHEGEWGRYTLFDVNFVPARVSVEQLDQGLVEGLASCTHRPQSGAGTGYSCARSGEQETRGAAVSAVVLGLITVLVLREPVIPPIGGVLMFAGWAVMSPCCCSSPHIPGYVSLRSLPRPRSEWRGHRKAGTRNECGVVVGLGWLLLTRVWPLA